MPRASASASQWSLPARNQVAPNDVVPNPASMVCTDRLALDVVAFAEERSRDIDAVAALAPPLVTAPLAASTNVCPYRQQQRLLRRRTGSTVVWRWRTHRAIPSTLRERLLGRSRRDRRRAVVLRARAAERGGLETEAWHAKRFEMAQLFGMRLPLRAIDRAEGSAVRVANEACVLHDASYWRCLRLEGGDRLTLVALLERTTDATRVVLTRRLESGREVACTLHQLDAQPAAAIAPARLMACHHHAATPSTSSEGARKAAVWIFVHEAAAGHARAALRSAAAAVDGSLRLSDDRSMLRFQLRGPTSHAVISRAFTPPATSEAAASAATAAAESSWLGAASSNAPSGVAMDGKAAWRALESLSSPADLPPRVVLGAAVLHPSRAPTPAGPHRHARRPATPPTPALRYLLTAWPPERCRSALYSHDDDGSGHDGAAAARGAPSSSSSQGAGSSRRAATDVLEMLLVQEPPAASAEEMRRGGSRLRGGFGCGWDVLVPREAGRAVWLALVLAGGRAIGQKELRTISFHMEQPLFPYDYPDTLAGLECELSEARGRRRLHERQPPKRRPGYTAMKVHFPFGPDWPHLLSLPASTLPLPEPPEQSASAAGGASSGEGASADAPPPSAAAAAAAAAAATAATAPATGAPPVPIMQFCQLRGAHASALVSASSSSAADAPPVPPVVQALLPRMLVRVSLAFPGKGVATSPSAIYAAEHQAIGAWKADCRWGGPMLLTGGRARVPEAGALLGFVTNGGYSRLAGSGVSVAFCAAQPFLALLCSSANVGQGRATAHRALGPVLVLVRNPASRQYRPALASLRV